MHFDGAKLWNKNAEGYGAICLGSKIMKHDRASSLFCEIFGRSIFDTVKKQTESYLCIIESAFVNFQFERVPGLKTEFRSINPQGEFISTI